MDPLNSGESLNPAFNATVAQAKRGRGFRRGDESGDAGIKRAAVAAGEDVSGGMLFFRHRPKLSAAAPLSTEAGPPLARG